MDLDDYLSRLNNDLESQLSRFNQSFTPDTSSAEENVSMGESLFCPECGFKNPASAKFCCNCGLPLTDSNSEDVREIEECDCEYVWDCQGILYTNTAILAEKYNCEPEDVFNVLDRFCEVAQNYDMYWFLVDAKDYDIEDYDNWLEHNKLISRIIKDNELASGIKAPLFIIGGHDVVPIPMANDVFGTADDGYIPCDMCYCFEGDFINEMWEDGDCCLDESCVRNNVSRLPLEDGKLDSSLEDDLEAYFERCCDFYDDGIGVSDVMMTANASWLPASKTMSEHLPLLHNADDNSEMVQDNMYVSPPVSTDDEDSMKPVNKTLGCVEMLLFNLHGADSPNMSGFYNDEDEAFNIDMLAESNALVFNTVACFGARYHGYSRDKSMLLSSLYEHNFLLYAGSLIPVPMTHLNVPEGVEVHEGSGSEHLMPIFCMEQFSGIPMGEAMMHAKLEYFNTFRHMERDDFSLATIMMFSLYGNPMLRMQRSEEVLRRAKEEHVLPILPQSKKTPIRMKLTERLVTCNNEASSSLLDQIRGLVDSNIDATHQTMQQHLYDQLGLEPRWLTHIDSFSIPNGDGSYEVGYSYAYDDKSRHYGGKQWVETDTCGNVKRVITTK